MLNVTNVNNDNTRDNGNVSNNGYYFNLSVTITHTYFLISLHINFPLIITSLFYLPVFPTVKSATLYSHTVYSPSLLYANRIFAITCSYYALGFGQLGEIQLLLVCLFWIKKKTTTTNAKEINVNVCCSRPHIKFIRHCQLLGMSVSGFSFYQQQNILIP